MPQDRHPLRPRNRLVTPSPTPRGLTSKLLGCLTRPRPGRPVRLAAAGRRVRRGHYAVGRVRRLLDLLGRVGTLVRLPLVILPAARVLPALVLAALVLPALVVGGLVRAVRAVGAVAVLPVIPGVRVTLVPVGPFAIPVSRPATAALAIVT